MTERTTRIAGWILMLLMLALGVGIGTFATMLPADPGDLLSFAGALIGAALTVAGAVYLFEHQRHQADAAARNVMRQLLQEILDGIEEVRNPKKIGDVEDYVPAVMTLTNARILREKVLAVQQARNWFSPSSAGMVRAFAQIEMFSIDPEAIRADIKPQVMYGGMPDVERHICELKSRAKVAIAQLEL